MHPPNDPAVDRRAKLARIAATLPKWKRKLLLLGLLVGIVGAVTKLALSTTRKAAAVTTTVVTPAPAKPSTGVRPQGSSGFVSGAPAPSTEPPTVTTTTQEPPASLTEKVSPYAAHIGFSLFAGLVVGVIFRAFLKLAASITALVVAGTLGLSYFNVFNIDMTAVKNETATVSSWAENQAVRLKDVVLSAFPSTTAAGAGFVMGFKRR